MPIRNVYNDDSFALQYIGGNLIPNANNVYTLGNSSFQFNTAYLADNLNITSTSNQLVLGGSNNVTIDSTAPSASRVYSIPDVGGNGTFYISGGNQTITNSLVPSADDTYDLGSSTSGWRDLYISNYAYLEGNSLQFNGPSSTVKTILVARNDAGTGTNLIDIPSSNGEMVTVSHTQTLTNKTLYLPIIETPSFTGISTGIIQNSSQYCFKAYNNVGQTGVTGAGEQYTIIFDTVDFQVGTGYDSSNGVFTAPIAGLYHFIANIQTGGWSTSNTGVACWIYHNTTKYNMHMTNNISYPTGYLVSNVSTTFKMASGDYITVGIEVDGSSTANINIISGSMNTNLIGSLLLPTG